MIVDAVTEEIETMGINLMKNNAVTEVQKNPQGKIDKNVFIFSTMGKKF